MVRLYTIGYGNRGFRDVADRLESALRKTRSSRFVVVDVRARPGSWCADLRYPAILKNFQVEGYDYRWIPNLGNNGDAEHIQLSNERLGMAELKVILEGLEPSEEAVLLCAERDHTRCHRTYIAKLAHDLYGVEVIHL